MRVVALRTLRQFWEKHPKAEGVMREWYAFVVRRSWHSTQDIKRDFASASFVGKNWVVFNISGSHYRIVVVALLNQGALYIRFVGTHAEYDRVDVKEV